MADKGKPDCENQPPPDPKCVDVDDEEYKFETAPFDPRFPNQNQTKHCAVSFIDYHRCIKLRGECYEPCEYFKRVYQSICPNAWHTKWTEQIENGTFAAKI